MNLKYKGFIFSLLAMVGGGVFTGCQSMEEMPPELIQSEVAHTEPVAQEGDSVTVTGSLMMPDMVRETRSTVGDVAKLYLFVFDENHRFVQRATAELTSGDRAPGAETHMPGGKTTVLDNRVRNFSVKLLATSRKRIIHFVANYDMPANRQEDYLLKDMDEGQFMSGLQAQDLRKPTLWRVFSFNGLSTNSFNNRVFHLLQNQAEVQLVMEPNVNFELRGFCLHNAPQKGTVAPYVSKETLNTTDPDEHYRDVLYSFPTTPDEPTLTSDNNVYEVLSANGDISPEGWKTNKSNIALFEYRNSEADRDKQVSVIMYGRQRVNGRLERPGYYKIDLKEDVSDAQKNYVGSDPYDIVRNHIYEVKVRSVANKGYETLQQAFDAPAGNNIFASVELQDYPQISDGKYKLDVGKTEVIITKPSTYEANISFVKVGQESNNLLGNVNVYYKRTPVATAFNNDPYIQSVSFSNGKLTITTRNPYPAQRKSYKFLVVGDNKDANNPSRILRTINVTLRQPYQFNASLTNSSGETSAQGKLMELSFDVPGSIPAQLFPYTVLIEAKGLTPLKDDYTNQNIKLVIRNKKIFYEYTVVTPTNGQKRRETLYFKRNASSATVGAVLSSELFADQTI